jgi:hypothetical protein
VEVVELMHLFLESDFVYDMQLDYVEENDDENNNNKQGNINNTSNRYAYARPKFQ